jgi:hypothetical protein
MKKVLISFLTSGGLIRSPSIPSKDMSEEPSSEDLDDADECSSPSGDTPVPFRGGDVDGGGPIPG